MSEPRWVTFDYFGVSASGKTKIWTVHSTAGGSLGEVRWFAPWRKYAYYPQTGCLFEEDCLRDIADFVEKVTREHRAKLSPPPVMMNG